MQIEAVDDALLLLVWQERLLLVGKIEIGEGDWTESERPGALLGQGFREVLRVIKVEIVLVALQSLSLLDLVFGGSVVLLGSLLCCLGFLGGGGSELSLLLLSGLEDNIFCLLNLFLLSSQLLTAPRCSTRNEGGERGQRRPG